VWGYYADAGQILGDAGHALFDIVMSTNDGKRVGPTIDRLEAAYAVHPVEVARSRALTVIRIACLRARAGDLGGALESTRTGLADAQGVHSARLSDDLRLLDSVLASVDPDPGLADEVAAARLRIAETASLQV
jgi:hypothetical protein